MEFKFKRKYTKFFILAVIVHALIVAYWLFFPVEILGSKQTKQVSTLLILINCELILIFYIGLFRKKYFAYYDKLVIKRSFFKTITIYYSEIQKIREHSRDTIFLGFGVRPSFTIYYKKRKKITVRSDNSSLLLKVIKNEIDIAKIK